MFRPSPLLLAVLFGWFGVACDRSPNSAGSLGAEGAPAANAPELPVGSMTVELMVEGDSCASCDLSLRRSLNTLPGVLRIRKGDSEQHLLVDFAPEELRSEQIVNTVYEAGYSAQVIVRAAECDGKRKC